jgi:hypothetical protein
MRAQVIKAPAGIGKTVEAARAVAATHLIVEVYVPTHANAKEWLDLIKQANPTKRVVIIAGRSAEGDDGNPLCAKDKLAEELARAGLSVYPHLCSRGQGAGVPPITCEHYERCPYIGQFQFAEVYIYVHAYLALPRTALEKWQPGWVIIDESFFQSCIGEIDIPFALLRHPDIPPAAQALCREIADLLSANQSVRGCIGNACATKTMKQARKALSKAGATLLPTMTEKEQRKALKSAASFSHVAKLLSHLASVTYLDFPQSVIVKQSEQKVTIHYRKPPSQRFIRPDGSYPELHILDASASPIILSRFFEIGKVFPLAVERKAHVIQCHSTRCATQSLAPERNSDKKSAEEAERRLRDIEHLVRRHAEDGQRVLVIGPSAVVGNPRTKIKPLIAIPDHCAFAHFNALRGIDVWKDFDVAIVVGRNQPPVDAVEDIARAVFACDFDPLQLSGKWSDEPRGYRLKGQMAGVEVPVHPDPRIQAVVEQIRECESTQAVDRLRLIHSTKPKTVILLSNTPLDIDVDELRTWDEVIYGSRLEQAWDKLDGVLPLSAVWLAKRFPELWKTAEAAKMDVKRNCKKGQTPNSIYIRNLTLFAYEYKPAHQRVWSRCLSRFPSLTIAAQTLQNILGEAVAVREPIGIAKARKAA